MRGRLRASVRLSVRISTRCPTPLSPPSPPPSARLPPRPRAPSPSLHSPPSVSYENVAHTRERRAARARVPQRRRPGAGAMDGPHCHLHHRPHHGGGRSQAVYVSPHRLLLHDWLHVRFFRVFTPVPKLTDDSSPMSLSCACPRIALHCTLHSSRNLTCARNCWDVK